MLDNLSNLRLILIGILACMVLALVFGAPKIVMESLTLAFATAFWAWYFAVRDSVSPWEMLPVAVFVLVMYYVLFSGNLLWLMFLVIWLFWYVLSDYFFPNVFAGMQKRNANGEDPILWAVIVYFFVIPGMAFFFILSILSATFP